MQDVEVDLAHKFATGAEPLEAPVADLCCTGTALNCIQATGRVVVHKFGAGSEYSRCLSRICAAPWQRALRFKSVPVAKNRDRHLEYSEPVRVFRHVSA